jgi:putative DNA primase/helicase
LYFPPGAKDLLENSDTEIVFVEAEKSVLAVMAWAMRKALSLLPIGTGGCWGWRGRIGKTVDADGSRVDEKGPLADLHWVKGRKAYLLFDSNATTNPKVEDARNEFRRALWELGATTVVLLNLPQGGWNGPDDYIAAVGDNAMGELFANATSHSWPEPKALEGALPPVQLLPPECLPKAFRNLIADVAERMQVPTDYPAAVAIVALAGCVNRRATIQPKKEDYSWVVVPNLWGAIVGPPGFMKSPVQRTVTLPLSHIEQMWRAEYKKEQANYEIAKEQADLSRQAWREQYKQAIKKNRPAPIEPDNTLTPPPQKRLIVTDATCEKLHEILSENEAGVLVARDELTGFLGELDKPGREGDRGFYLTAWSGDAGFAVDRIGRGSILVSAVCVSLIANVQPVRLRYYLSDALAGGPSDDGLFPRFQILVWPDHTEKWHLVDRPPRATSVATAERVFSVLANLSADNPVKLRFADDAQALFYDWLAELEHRVRGDSLPPVLVSHLAKYRSLMPSLAGLFELADFVAADGVLEDRLLISLEHAKQAAAFCEYLESHAKRVYSCTVSPERNAAITLLGQLKRGALPESFTTRDVYLKGWSGLDTPEEARKALGVLESHFWIERVNTQPTAVGGRPSEVWITNPRIVRDAK